MKLFENWLTNVKALQAFHLLRQGAIILVAILFAKSNLSTDEIGSFEQLMYIGNTISFFWVAGLIQGFLTTFPDLSSKNQRSYIFSAYLLFLGISISLFALFYFFKAPLVQFFTENTSLPYYELFLCYLLFNMPTYLVENIYLLKDKPRNIFLFGVLSFIGHIIVLILPIWLGLPFVVSFYGLLGLAIVKHIWLLILLVQTASINWRFDLVRPWLSLSLPLMLYAFLGGLMQTFDNWLINYWYDGDPEQFAIFRYGARELPLALALAAAFSTAMLPEIRKNLENALSAIKNKGLKLFHLLFPFSILLLLTSTYWFPIVFSESFLESIVVFDTYLLILTSRLIFSRTILMGLKDNNTVLLISILEFIINVLLSFWLIQLFGLMGVAIATVLAYGVEKLFICIYLSFKHNIKLNTYTSVPWWVLYTAIMLILFIAKNIEYFS